MSDIPAPGDSVTVIGSDCAFKGELSFGGTMRFEGRFEGRITSKGKLQFGRGAQVQAEVLVGRLNVEGGFSGNVQAVDRVELSSSARFQGDITAPKLIVGEGATLLGKMSIGLASGQTTPVTPHKAEAVKK